ncbi:MAG TPA: hypothetical protein V6D17_18570 [Candidatus Obscuribacterales bacterium]
MARPRAVDQGNGYSGRFERRPEFLFNSVVRQVIDANVREHKVKDLMVARVEDVFSGNNEAFLVFGKPNAAMVVPKADGSGYQKFAAYSVWRQDANIEDVTRNSGSFVQSGIWLRFLDLPEHAHQRLRDGMEKYKGRKYRTCVNGNMHVLQHAGFASGDKPLTKITWPYQLMRTLINNGLTFEGKPIRFEVVRTTRLTMEGYTRGIIFAELSTPWRHFKKRPLGAKVAHVLGAPVRMLHRNTPKSTAIAAEVAPALPSDVPYVDDLRVRVTQASAPGQVLRQVWGPHALFEATVERVNVDDYLPRALRPFPQANPSLVTRIKKAVLFSKPVIWLMRLMMGAVNLVEIGVFSESDVYDMLRTHSDASPNIYNTVIVRMPPAEPGRAPVTRFIISRITVKSKLIDWVLSKHVLMSGYLWAPKSASEEPDRSKPFVVWAGESWKTADGKLKARGNSGTYQPTDAEDDAMVAFTQAVLPHLVVEKAPMPGKE